MTGRVLPIDPTEDGRPYASAWLRRNAATEEAIFTAIYSMQHRANHSFMNIALPLLRDNDRYIAASERQHRRIHPI
ncbi:hypothetical protein JCM19037_3039 [Geomicrobium sp. JCM 19037]|uniref:hypothetical protein n=1 Tax=Geomicrobium sp. JCM 19037 TaxID=1460634 RepID=UPI00045F36F1|nr:hypothetical protein [Geomicrobium sp. JCM 19037]GAK04607.1 hypothetical protein JCM19037_3039 [Geomicrobium sp. JCM 19037]